MTVPQHFQLGRVILGNSWIQGRELFGMRFIDTLAATFSGTVCGLLIFIRSHLDAPKTFSFFIYVGRSHDAMSSLWRDLSERADRYSKNADSSRNSDVVWRFSY